MRGTCSATLAAHIVPERNHPSDEQFIRRFKHQPDCSVIGPQDWQRFAGFLSLNDVAGALSLYPEGTPRHKENPDDIQILDEKHLDEIFERLIRRPLFAGEEGIRLSLAGAQDKLAVRLIGDKLALMRGGAPTTHILKTMISVRHEVTNSVPNELFCLMLAARCGLSVPQRQMRRTPNQPYLLVARHDRRWQGNEVVRLHQGDFCQALSIPPENKYEREGGPGISTCLGKIQKHCIEPLPGRLAFLKILPDQPGIATNPS